MTEPELKVFLICASVVVWSLLTTVLSLVWN